MDENEPPRRYGLAEVILIIIFIGSILGGMLYLPLAQACVQSLQAGKGTELIWGGAFIQALGVYSIAVLLTAVQAGVRAKRLPVWVRVLSGVPAALGILLCAYLFYLSHAN